MVYIFTFFLGIFVFGFLFIVLKLTKFGTEVPFEVVNTVLYGFVTNKKKNEYLDLWEPGNRKNHIRVSNTNDDGDLSLICKCSLRGVDQQQLDKTLISIDLMFPHNRNFQILRAEPQVFLIVEFGKDFVSAVRFCELIFSKAYDMDGNLVKMIGGNKDDPTFSKLAKAVRQELS